MGLTPETLTFEGSNKVQLHGQSFEIRKSDETLLCRYEHTSPVSLAVVTDIGSGTVTPIPSRFAVKAYNSPVLYEREKSTYERMKDLQGDIVPEIYGFARWHNVSEQVIAMEFLDGKHLNDAISDASQIGSVRRVLIYCYEKLAERNVNQSDPKVGHVTAVELRGWAYLHWLPRIMFRTSYKNIMAVKSVSWWQFLPTLYRIAIVDFDWAYLDNDPEDLHRTIRNDVESIANDLEKLMKEQRRAKVRQHGVSTLDS